MNTLIARALALLLFVTVTGISRGASVVTLTLAGSATTSEATGAPLTYTFTRADDTSTALVVSFTTGGTATPVSDYSLASTAPLDTALGTITIPAGSASADVTLTPVNDTAVEGTETAALTLAPGSGYDVGTAGAVSVTIIDNDTATIGFATASSAVAESVGNEALGLVLTISANGAGTPTLTHDVTCNVTATGGTATGGGTDYTLPGLVTFSAGALNGATQTASMAIVDDRTVEGNETATLGLAIGSDGTGGQVGIAAGAAASHTTTINDNDNAMIRYLVATSSVGEGAGNDILTFRLDFSTTGTGSLSIAHDCTFAVTATGGTATGGGVDYTLPGSITYTAGSGNGATRTANLAIVNDTLVEGAETVELGLTVVTDGNGGRAHIATGGFQFHTATITDNDTATIGFATANSTVAESVGNEALGLVLTISANGAGTPALAHDVTCNVVTTGGTATGGGTDYTLPGSVTFSTGALNGATQTASLAIVDDRTVEGNETATLGLAIGSDGTGGQVGIASGAAANHTTTINDNDNAMIRYLVATSSVGEGAGNDVLTFRLDFSVTGTGSLSIAHDCTFAVTATGGTATGGGVDYTLPGSITYTAGSGNGATRTANLAIINDRIVEGDETVELGLTVVNDGNGGRAHIATGGFQFHTATITDDDNAMIRYLVPTSNVNEGSGNDLLNFRLDFSVSGTGSMYIAHDVTFAVTATGGTATGDGVDYTLPGAITYTAGSGNGATRTANLAIVDDALVEEDETVELGLIVVTDGNGGRAHIATGGFQFHTATIVDNDPVSGDPSDTTGPAGGTMTLTPSSPVDASAGLVVSFANWIDQNMPLSYAVLIDDIVVSAPGPFPSRDLLGPATPGMHILKGRIFDALNNVTEVTQELVILTVQESWRQHQFGVMANTPIAGDDADPNNNGIKNLLEYALGGDPLGSATGTGILPQLGLSAGNTLQISFTREVGHTDLTLTVYAADSVAGPWTPLAQSTRGGAFAVLEPGATAPETGTGNTRNVIVTDPYPVSDPAHPQRFLLLEATH